MLGTEAFHYEEAEKSVFKFTSSLTTQGHEPR